MRKSELATDSIIVSSWFETRVSNYSWVSYIYIYIWYINCHQNTLRFVEILWNTAPLGRTSAGTMMTMYVHIFTGLPIVLHIYASVNRGSIGSDKGLSPGRRQAIIWTNAEILPIGPLRINFSEILIEINQFSFKKMHLKVSSAKMAAILSRGRWVKADTALRED